MSKENHTIDEAFAAGVKEADGDWGITYDHDANSPRSVAYDNGRNVGEMPEPWRSLLAAAPDLLAACRAMARMGDWTGAVPDGFTAAWEASMHAIAKATDTHPPAQV